ncbi:MAG TPA: L-rhamnose mutarotase [Edaphobacter sp.]
MPRYCLTLDLKNDEAMIAEYRRYHEKIWPEIRDSFYAAGVQSLEMYLTGNRMFMIIDADENFSLAAKAAADAADPKVQEWEALMGQYQQPLPNARPGQRWMLMHRIFNLADQ